MDHKVHWFSTLMDLLFCLALVSAFVHGGLAGELQAEETELYLPLIMKPIIFQESVGLLDTDFNSTGWVTTEMGLNYEWANDVAIQRDGKIIAAGGAVPVSGMAFALVRYNPDGSLDTTFDGDGKVYTDWSGAYDECYDIALQSDGKIVAVGYFTDATMNFGIVRYNPDGSLDTTFANNGIQMTDFDYTEDTARAVALQPDGKIVVAGEADGTTVDFALARYNPDGSLDTTFNGSGKVLLSFTNNDDRAYDIAIQPDGKIVVAGVALGTTRDFALARLNPNGSLDTTFSGDGKLVTDFGLSDRAYALALQPDGKILAVGYTSFDQNVALARYNIDGSLDVTFDSDGMVTTDFTGDIEYAMGIVIQPNGKIIITGYGFIVGDTDILLARYNPDGSLDSSFSEDGKLMTAYTDGKEGAVAIALQPDGRIVVAGSTIVDVFDYSFTVARFK